MEKTLIFSSANEVRLSKLLRFIIISLNLRPRKHFFTLDCRNSQLLFYYSHGSAQQRFFRFFG